MAKSLLRLEARKLRSKGISVRKIAQELKISKDSASRWTRDIILTVEQLENLTQSKLKGGELGRLKGALIQKKRRLKLIEDSKILGIEMLASLSERELLIAGISLYWGEGRKKSRRVGFCNSDPRMIKFYIHWLQSYFNVKLEDLRGYIGINEIHFERESIVKQYWSEVTGILLSQFRKTYFKKAANKKVYENFNEHYGTLSIELIKPVPIYYKIMGLIEGLCMAA